VSEWIGRIVRLQIQAEPVKASGRYDPTRIVTAAAASIGEAGMLLQSDSGWLVDAHHRAHPRARGGGNRPLSIGFTGHYAAMTDRFGDVSVGIAGENIIIDGPAVRLEEIVNGLVIRRPDGTEIELQTPRPAAPCLPFTSFLVGSETVLPREAITEELAFLSGGTRGFLVEMGRPAPQTVIEVGDEVARSNRRR